MLRTILSLAAFVAFSSACSSESPESAQSGQTVLERDRGASVPVQLPQKPDITVARILTDIVGKQVTATDSAAQSQPMQWTFEADEPKTAEIIERQASDTNLSLVIQLNTGGAPGSDDANVQLSGRLRLEYEWNGQDWILRRVQNMTFRYTRGVWT